MAPLEPPLVAAPSVGEGCSRRAQVARSHRSDVRYLLEGHGEPATVIAVVHTDTLTVSTTERVELVDLTERVTAAVAVRGVREGLVNVCSLHTTAAELVTRPESSLLPALKQALEGPPSPGGDWGAGETRGGGPVDATAHLGVFMLAHSLTLQVSEGELVLGEWQRVLLAELDGPRARQLRLQVWGTP